MQAVQTIHIIDDEVVIRISLQALLEAEGYVVQGHESVQSFLDTYLNGDFGCVVTDLYMPQISGLELMCEMSKLRVGVPAIVISGLMDARLSQASEEKGAFRCFQKPVDLYALLVAIHAALVHTYERNQNLAFPRGCIGVADGPIG